MISFKMFFSGELEKVVTNFKIMKSKYIYIYIYIYLNS